MTYGMCHRQQCCDCIVNIVFCGHCKISSFYSKAMYIIIVPNLFYYIRRNLIKSAVTTKLFEKAEIPKLVNKNLRLITQECAIIKMSVRSGNLYNVKKVLNKKGVHVDCSKVMLQR